MEIKTLFLIFGIGVAALAVIVSIFGLRVKSFPSRPVLTVLIVLGVIGVVGTGYYGVKLQMEEAEEREHGDQNIVGEEASVAPIVIPANFI